MLDGAGGAALGDSLSAEHQAAFVRRGEKGRPSIARNRPRPRHRAGASDGAGLPAGTVHPQPVRIGAGLYFGGSPPGGRPLPAGADSDGRVRAGAGADRRQRRVCAQSGAGADADGRLPEGTDPAGDQAVLR